MEIIEQIGSYAGLAAVVGLAVLSALYFSQARDVKRLREWAGRAPERVPTSYPHRVVAQPAQTQRPQGAPAPPPRVSAPPGAQPSGAGAGPAVAPGPYATPAAARAAETATEGVGAPAVSQNTVVHPPPRPPPQTLPPRQPPPGLGGHFAREAQIARQREEAQRREQELAAGGGAAEDEQPEDEQPEDEHREGAELEGAELEGEELESHEFEELESHEFEAQREDEEGATSQPPGDSGEQPGQAGDRAQPAVTASAPPPPLPPITGANRPLPPRPAPPGVRSPSQQGPILPPYEKSRPGAGPWESRTFSPAKAALAVGTAVVVVAAGAFGVLQLTGGDDSPSAPEERAAPASEKGARKGKAASRKGAVNPRTVTVSVLNGTTVGGLAAQLGDRLEAQGFQLGNVTNNTDQQRAESVVLFAPGAEAEARDVGRRLKIDQREPIDPDSQTRAGDASVVVVTGNDLNE